MNEITFIEHPYPHDDEDDPFYIFLPGIDKYFEIVKDNTDVVGTVYTAEDYETADGLLCPFYINWIELSDRFRGKHLLRPILRALYERFGDIYFEGSEDATKYYRHIGCEELGIDEITELPKFRYSGQ